MTKNSPDARDRRSRRRTVWVLGGIGLLVLGLAWIGRRRPPVPAGAGAGSDHGTVPEVAAAVGIAVAAGAPAREGPAGSRVESDRARSFRRAETRPGALVAAGRPAWEYRIRTNGVLDGRRMTNDLAYRGEVKRHLKLRALLRSPARETPECAAIIGLVERRGLSLAAVPDLYHALWEARTAERREQAAAGVTERNSIGFVRSVATEDFLHRFRRDFAVDPGPVFEELVGLPIEPTVYFGVPDVGLRPGEVLLSD